MTKSDSFLTFIDQLPVAIAMWVLLGLIVVAFVIFSAILFWHWRMYSTGKFTTVSNMILYLSVSLIFIVIMIGSAVMYSIV